MNSEEEKRRKNREKQRKYRASLSDEKLKEIRSQNAEAARRRRKENPEHVYEVDRRSKQRNKEKVKARQKKYYETNREVLLAQKKEYYEANKELITAKIRAYRWSDIEAHRKKMRDRWASLSPEEKKKANDIKKRAVAKKPEHYRKKNREWYQRTYEQRKGVIQQRTLLRRARIANAPKVERVTREKVLERWGSSCHICGLPINLEVSSASHKAEQGWEKGLHLDHVIPLSRGGEHTLQNIKPAHAMCNLKKNTSFMSDY